MLIIFHNGSFIPWIRLSWNSSGFEKTSIFSLYKDCRFKLNALFLGTATNFFSVLWRIPQNRISSCLQKIPRVLVQYHSDIWWYKLVSISMITIVKCENTWLHVTFHWWLSTAKMTGVFLFVSSHRQNAAGKL